jgi:hypothetical protein
MQKITKNAAHFKRLVGISQDHFDYVVRWLEIYESEIKKQNAQKKRFNYVKSLP